MVRAMKVGVFSAILSGMPLRKALRTIADLGCETVELGHGILECSLVAIK